MVSRMFYRADWLKRRFDLFCNKPVLVYSSFFSVFVSDNHYFILMRHVSVLESDGVALMIPYFLSGLVVPVTKAEANEVLQDGITRIWIAGKLGISDSDFADYKTLSLERIEGVTYLNKIG